MTRRAAWLAALLAAGCSGSGNAPGGGSCLDQCQADPMQSGRQYCGTDGKTYGGCQWACQGMPTGVQVFPGACQANGMPAADSPPAPADGDDVCDWVEVGTEWMAVECAADFDVPMETFSDELGAAINPGESVGGIAPPMMAGDVDHRTRFLGVRNQGGSAACTAFAAVGALEAAVSSATGEKVALSEMQMWARYHKPDVGQMAQAAQKGLVSAASASAGGFAYDDKTALAWEKNQSAPDAGKLATLDAMNLFELGALAPIPPDPTTMRPSVAKIREGLAEGIDIFAGLSVGPEFQQVDGSGVIKDYAGSAQAMGHAVLIVGYRTINGQTYYILRNSWGAGWGDGGYGYLSEKSLGDNLRLALAFAVRRNSAVMVQTCAMGQAAGLDGTCRMRCPDGSLADATGQCAGAPITCPSGQTGDATGVCVAACATGMSMAAGYAADCTERGCTWTLTDGTFGCAAGAGMTCTRFCAAPTCQAATSKNEFMMTVPTCALRAM